MNIQISQIVEMLYGLLAIIGILLGTIWYFMRNEMADIKEALAKLEKTVINMLVDHVSKEDCKRIRDDNKRQK